MTAAMPMPTATCVDCGLYKPVELTHSLGNKVWIDDGAGTEANANNGVLDAGELMVADGVTLELKDSAGTAITSTTTDKGYYLFSGLKGGGLQGLRGSQQLCSRRQTRRLQRQYRRQRSRCQPEY